ncbi:TadE/TadG family type IV pilus assembly protein [Primorskyibacter sp. S187A]|uniref:TadE/TadG family type IV pilus assembly protein n=1 Tax=Primorskyibacter sp. S187A TaxID=3415130 RepID=UPI003C7D693C
MTSKLCRFAKAFRSDESGNANTVSFAIWTPALLLTLATAMEVGVYTARATLLERGMDMVARDIRLDTGIPPQHNEIKAAICEKASIIPDCAANLRLEMIPQDMRNWQSISAVADCTDRSKEVAPLRSFTPGQDNEMMILRACAKIQPILPMTWLAGAIETDAAGDYAVVAISAFVQEPR